MTRAVFIPLLTSLVLACGASSDDAELVRAEVARLEQRVVFGEPAPDETYAVNVYAPGSTCTGTLVAPNLVLTALHCVSPLETGTFHCGLDGIPIRTEPGAGDLAPALAPAEVGIGQGEFPPRVAEIGIRRVFSTDSTHICRNDLALLVLDGVVDGDIMPLRLRKDTFPGEVMRVVGYGRTESRYDDVQRRMRDDIRVLDVGAAKEGEAQGAAPLRTFSIGQSVCQGDSGGPAISSSDAVAGVYSITPADCVTPDATNIFTRVALFEPLILKAFEEAGYEPWFEGEPGPGFPDEDINDETEATPGEINDDATPVPQLTPDSGIEQLDTGMGAENAASPVGDDGADHDLSEDPDAPSPEHEQPPPRTRRTPSGCTIKSVQRAPRLSSRWYWGLAIIGISCRRSRRRKTARMFRQPDTTDSP